MDRVGQKFGKLTFLKRLNEKIDGRFLWKIRCDCGKIIKSISTNIITGRTTSCGCYKKEYLLKDWANQKFNRITLTKRSDKKSGTAFLWEGICDCGNGVLVRPRDAATGRVKSCGCLQFEKFRARWFKLTHDKDKK
jgi:hypothetical protein